jgi:voltage-gated potassium channel
MNWGKIRKQTHQIIFEADTKAGKLFDILLLIFILISILAVMLDSVQSFSQQWHRIFYIIEWFFTLIFTIEYILRLWSTKAIFRYFTSFYGIIDILSILPSYLSLFIVNSHFLMVIRILRIFRLFRVFGLSKYLSASSFLLKSIYASRFKISVFMLSVLFLVTILGSIMYLIEGPAHGFTSIPRSIYWAIVTLTTVGYGDIAPQTVLGQALASLVMLLGYAIIAVPTGIITSEIVSESHRKSYPNNTQVCQNCNDDKQADGAKYCKSCGHPL